MAVMVPLGAIFRALVEKDCAPEWTADGLGIVATCPCCHEPRGLLVTTAGALQASRILFPFLRHLPGSDRVLIFGSNGFLLRAAPILVGVAKLLGKPVHVRVFGGSLDRFCTDLAPAMRRILLGTLRRADGVHVQTRLLYDRLRPWIGASLHVAPGYRRLPDRQPDVVSTVDEGLRLIYVGHVREENRCPEMGGGSRI